MIVGYFCLRKNVAIFSFMPKVIILHFQFRSHLLQRSVHEPSRPEGLLPCAHSGLLHNEILTACPCTVPAARQRTFQVNSLGVSVFIWMAHVNTH